MCEKKCGPFLFKAETSATSKHYCHMSLAKVTNPYYTPQELEAKLQDERFMRVKANQAAKQEQWNNTRVTRDLRVLSDPDYQLPLLEEAESFVASKWDKQQCIEASKIDQYLEVVESCVKDYSKALRLREESLAFLTPLGLGGLILQEAKEKKPYLNYPGFSTSLTTTYDSEVEGSRGATIRMEQVSKYLFERCLKLQEVVYSLSQIKKRLPTPQEEAENLQKRKRLQQVLLSQKPTHRTLPRPLSKTLVHKVTKHKRKRPGQGKDKPRHKVPACRRLFVDEEEVKMVEENQ